MDSYGHPTDKTIQKLSDKKIRIYRNDKQGSIVFTTDGKKVTASQKEWSLNVESATPTVKPAATKAPKPSVSPQQETVTYANCTAVRATGKAPLYKKGDPGYSAKLDRDKDGVACE